MLPNSHPTLRSKGLIFFGASAAAVAPAFFLLPGAEERMAMQAAKWGPRWRRGFAKMTPHVEHHAAKFQPRIEKGVQRVDPPLKRAALAIDSRMQKVFKPFKEMSERNLK